MPAKLSKSSIDLGIVTTDPDAMIGFYRDVLGFEDAGEFTAFGATIRRLLCGDSSVKIVVNATPPPVTAVPGGMQAATGFRYLTVSVDNLDEIVADCGAAGRRIMVPVTETRPGVRVAMVEDPDGNCVELLSSN
jgi:catechol 2,3-dioxygenase-like lactoylglutathione lyase family enzyme